MNFKISIPKVTVRTVQNPPQDLREWIRPPRAIPCATQTCPRCKRSIASALRHHCPK
jgi:hypothetical protein